MSISSCSALVGVPGAAAHAASKADVRNHTKTAALYCAAQEEAAAVAVLLASDEAAHMTSAELDIAGGILTGSAAAPAADSSGH